MRLAICQPTIIPPAASKPRNEHCIKPGVTQCCTRRRVRIGRGDVDCGERRYHGEGERKLADRYHDEASALNAVTLTIS